MLFRCSCGVWTQGGVSWDKAAWQCGLVYVCPAGFTCFGNGQEPKFLAALRGICLARDAQGACTQYGAGQLALFGTAKKPAAVALESLAMGRAESVRLVHVDVKLATSITVKDTASLSIVNSTVAPSSPNPITLTISGTANLHIAGTMFVKTTFSLAAQGQLSIVGGSGVRISKITVTGGGSGLICDAVFAGPAEVSGAGSKLTIADVSGAPAPVVDYDGGGRGRRGRQHRQGGARGLHGAGRAACQALSTGVDLLV